MTAIAGRGRRGSKALRLALHRHLPQLAHTRSPRERRFIALLDEAGTPMPELNVRVEGILVDAVWRTEKVVVELDGRQGHATPARLERDRRNEMRLRAAGYTILRYTWQQIADQPEAVIADLVAVLTAASSAVPAAVRGSR